jgi:hypothetical protein
MTTTLPASRSGRGLTIASRVFGFAIALGGLALALRFGDDALGDANAFWKGLPYFLGPAITAGLIVVAGDVGRAAEASVPRWQRAAGVLALAGLFALALKASDARLTQGGGETGAWGFLKAILPASSALLLLLAAPDLSLRGTSRAALGLVAGLLTVAVGVAVGLHDASRAPAWQFWAFLGSVIGPAAGGLLLITAALVDQAARPVLIRWWTCAVAALIVAGALAHSIWLADLAPENGAWIGLANLASRLSLALLILIVGRSIAPAAAVAAAVVIGAALVAHAVWFTSTFDDPAVSTLWTWLLLATSSLATPVLALFLSFWLWYRAAVAQTSSRRGRA